MKTYRDSRYSHPPINNKQRVKQPSKKRGDGLPAIQGSTRRTKSPPDAPSPRKKSRMGGYLSILGAIALLAASGGLIVGGIWLGILLMVNPDAVVWLNQYLPSWTRIPIAATSPPKTLPTIQKDIRSLGLIPGEVLSLSQGGADGADTEFLLPVMASAANCQLDCQQIVELRVYQPTSLNGEKGYYRLVSQLPIKGPEEYIVLSSLASTASDKAVSSRALPLTKLARFNDNVPKEGFWFNLTGKRVAGDTPATYGQVLHYNPDQTHLSVMVQWTSPEGQNPYWEQITDNSTPELIIDRTVGLEPMFTVYQVRPRNFVPNPIFLEEISLTEPAIDTSSYRDALLLARNGLWSMAWQQLQALKRQNWSPAARAQMDVIGLHAKTTQAQAKQAWATPSATILANLIDGRWADALLVFRSSDFGMPFQEIVSMLKSDSGRLWARVEAAREVKPDDNDIKAWGALILTAREGRAKAIAWLQEQSSPTTPASTKETSGNVKPEDIAKQDAIASFDNQIYELLDRLDAALAEVSPTSSHLSQIVGTAQIVSNVNPSDWLQPENYQEDRETGIWEPGKSNSSFPPSPPPPLTKQLEPQQVWYQVQVSAFNNGQRWLQAPFPDFSQPVRPSTSQLWRYLGLNTDPQIQITVWNAEGQQESAIATVKAVAYRGGTIQLLAAGEILPAAIPKVGAPFTFSNRLLAHTDAALRWSEVGSITLSDLDLVQPQWVSAILPALWRELLESGQFQQGTVPSKAQMLREIGHWLLQPIELTGNDKPDAVLTLYEDLSGAMRKPDVKPPLQNSQLYKPRTLIFSDAGALLYSEFSQDASASVKAIAELGDDEPAALVLDDSRTYSLKRWSSQNKRFE